VSTNNRQELEDILRAIRLIDLTAAEVVGLIAILGPVRDRIQPPPPPRQPEPLRLVHSAGNPKALARV
jgi:hypothetical protein